MNSLEQAAKALANDLRFMAPPSATLLIIVEHLEAFTREREVRIAILEAAFCHIHVANCQDSLCKTCGFDIRDPIHKREL